jgi:hypothetical protein
VALRKSRAHLIESPALPDVSILPSKAVTPSPTCPVYSVPDSGTKSTERVSSYDLKRMFGCRTLQDWRMLKRTGMGLHVFYEGDPPLSIGDMATINRNRHGTLLSRPKHALHTVGLDIGYGEGTSPGGHKYVLTLVDLATRQTWVYGLRTKGAESIINALWSFFIDAGGIPKRICCNSDSSFVKGQVYAFLRRKKGIRIGASPPGRQSQNGALKQQWRTATSMARALLVEAPMPRCYWFWALREAVICMNMLPCRPAVPGTHTNSQAHEFEYFSPATMAHARAATESLLPLTTPFKLFYGTQPDSRTLFQWGCLGYFCRVCASSGGRGQFDMHSSIGIALGRSNHTNGMIFLGPGHSTHEGICQLQARS